MEFRHIGRTGLRVSPICLGTMTFGTQCDKKTAFQILDKAYDKGVNFLDTAEIYPVPPDAKTTGITEEIVGEWLTSKPRESLIIATKVVGSASGWFSPPVRFGLTSMDSHQIKTAIEGSLKRLGTDYIDLYQMHWPDPIVPLEETMRAFDALVQEGKVRYIGTSNDNAYTTTKANMISRYEGLSRFESVQNNFSLLNRRALDDIADMCRRESISLLPYSPIAGGVLSGKYNGDGNRPGRFTRYAQSENPRVRGIANRFLNEKTLKSTEEYLRIARAADLHPVTLATAWSKQFDFVASTIIGATSAEQLDDSLAAMEVELDQETLDRCDKVHREILYPMG